MTTVNGSNPNVTAATTKNTNEKHPVRNTLLGATAGAVVAGAAGYLKQPSKDEVKLGLKNEYLADFNRRNEIWKISENTTKEEKTLFKLVAAKAFRLQKDQLKADIEKGLKFKKGSKYAAIGAAVVGAIALAGTYLLGNKSEKAE